jgi:hypothetical protein
MEEIESTATLYILSVKGGYYDADGDIAELLADAHFFSTPQEAMTFRRVHDPRHHIDCAILLQLTIFIGEAG